MKVALVFSILFQLCGFVHVPAYGQDRDNTEIATPVSEAAAGLDLQAVAELFKDSRDLEAFERAINSSAVGVNNLDLNDDGDVDYLRVLEEVEGDHHLVVLQAALGENEYQDVATIEVEKTGEDSHNLQVTGNTVLYGPGYYVVPAPVHVHSWPIVTWMYRPYYRPYRSVFIFGRYPHWWRPYRPVTVNVYRTRTVRFTTRNTFTVTRTRTVQAVHRVPYQPTSSTLVRKQTTVSRRTAAPRGTATGSRASSAKAVKTGKRGSANQKARAKQGKAGKAKVKQGRGARGGKAKKSKGKGRGRRPGC